MRDLEEKVWQYLNRSGKHMTSEDDVKRQYLDGAEFVIEWKDKGGMSIPTARINMIEVLLYVNHELSNKLGRLAVFVNDKCVNHNTQG